MIELQALAALSELDRARERILARRPGPPILAAAAGAALGWVVRGIILRGEG
jgi:hypothetical protein